MSCITEVPLNKIENSNPLTQDIQKIMPNNQAESKNDNDEEKVPIIELFPWITEFRTMCKGILENQTMASLTELMQYYIRNISISVNECCTKPLKAFRLKESMSESLLLFLYIYRTLSEEHNKHIYLSYMSDILAKYIDMELKASKRSKEDHGKICTRIISCFYIFLGNSTEHLLNTLMKIQLMSRNYHDILHPIIKKIMKLVPPHPESTMMYVRYFLIYRIWRKLNSDTVVKNEITTLAINSLGSPPVTFSPPTLEEVLPKVPKSQTYCTKSLLQQKFDAKRSCELFIELCKKASRNRSLQPGDNPPCINSKLLIDNNSSIVSGKNNQDSVSPLSKSDSNNLNDQTNITPLGIISNNLSDSLAIPKSIMSSKIVSKRKSKSSNEIVVIDLTNDEVSENIIRKKTNKKLAWLEEVKKRVTLKTAKTSLKIKKQNLCENLANPEDYTSSSHHMVEPLLSTTTSVTSELKNISTSVVSDSKNTNSNQSSENNMCFVNQAASDTITLTDDDCGTTNDNSRRSSSLAITTKSQNDSDSSTKSVLHATQVHNNNEENCTSENTDWIQSSSENVNNMDDTFTVIKTTVDEESSFCTRLHTNPMSAKNESDTKADAPEIMDSQPSSDIIMNRDQESQEMILHLIRTECSEDVDENVSKHNLDLDRVPAKEYNVHAEAEDCTKTSCVQKTNENNIPYATINKYAHQEIIDSEGAAELSDKNTVNGNFTYSVMDTDHPKTQVEIQMNNYAAEIDCTTHNIVTIDGEKQCNSLANTNGKEYNTFEEKQATCRQAGEDECEQDDARTYPCRTDSVKHVDYDSIERGCDENLTGENNVIHTHFVKHSSPESIAKTDFLQRTCSPVHVVRDNGYIIHDSELHGNIDGLSLLASVSQHVPHLKADSKLTQNQIKVKDYASLRKASSQQIEVADVNDTFNNISQLCENPTPDVINRIVGIYPEETLDKVALHVEVSSTSDVEHDNVKESSNTVLQVVDSTVEYDTHVLTNNLISMENNIQPAKENTNVILNGETVVLLQKSPNSNLYIINKAVENSKDEVNDLETCGLKEKTWLHHPTEDSSSVEINRTDQNLLNFDIPQYSKEFLGQEYKYSVGRTKGIKVELEEAAEEKNITNFVDTKAYVKKNSLLTDSVISTAHHRYQDISITPVSLDKRKVSAKSNLPYGQGVKEEYINHITTSCGIQAYQAVHPHQQSVIEAQRPLHVPASHSNNIPSIYNNCPTTADLCVPYHKHCTSVSCNVQINGTNSLRQHSQTSSACGRTHCSCLDCAYDIVTHCRQYLHPSTEAHMSCIENKSYFLSAHSSVQTSAVQEHEKTSSGTAISKLYDDDQLLCKIEQNLVKVNPLEDIDPKCNSEKIINKDLDNKLPLKKRLKAHAMMTMVYEKLPKKTVNSSYPGMPMMSIAALEALDNIKEPQAVKPHFESSAEKKDVSFDSRHFNSNIVRTDYYKDIYTSSATCSNIDGTFKKHDSQYNSAQTSGSTTYSQSYHQKTFKTPAQRKQGSVSELSPSLKRFNVESPVHEIPPKKAKKPSSPSRQTRSSKRNVPKVNYSYTDIDPEWNPSGEAKRKRKKTSR